MNLNMKHFEAFKASWSGEVPKDPGSRNSPRDWASSTNLGIRLPNETMTRELLFKIVADPAIDTPEICWSILAWGGMHGGNRDALITSPDKEWLNVAKAVRDGEHSRGSAYDSFYGLKANNRLPGMGPAYYTKLIFFLMPRNGALPVGYIMDQWLGCSINLLFGSEIVLMDCTHSWKLSKGRPAVGSNFTVSKFNERKRYELFCGCIEKIADEIGIEPEMVELLLMSGGGKTKRPWRAHVIEHRSMPDQPQRIGCLND